MIIICKEHFWSCAQVKTIMTRLFHCFGKEKHFKTVEHAVYKIRRFYLSACFYIILFKSCFLSVFLEHIRKKERMKGNPELYRRIIIQSDVKCCNFLPAEESSHFYFGVIWSCFRSHNSEEPWVFAPVRQKWRWCSPWQLKKKRCFSRRNEANVSISISSAMFTVVTNFCISP